MRILTGWQAERWKRFKVVSRGRVQVHFSCKQVVNLDSLKEAGSRSIWLAFHFHALEKEMATHSSVLAWRIPGMGEPGGLLSMGLQSRTQLK